MGGGTTPTSAIQPLSPGVAPTSATGAAALLKAINPWSLPHLSGAPLGQGSGLGLGEEGTRGKGTAGTQNIGTDTQHPRNSRSTRVKAKGTSIEPIHHVR